MLYHLLPPSSTKASSSQTILHSRATNFANWYSQTRLNIPDMAMGSFSSGGPAPAAPAAAVEEEEAAPVQQEKTLFNLKLMSFEAGSKPKIIKEIKSMLGLSLVDSKKFVESAPKLMKEAVPKEEAEKIVEVIKGLGGVVVME
jgi:large subunit ribosomal protein L7/L12